MKTRDIVLISWLVLPVVSTMTFSANRTVTNADASKLNPAAAIVQQTVVAHTERRKATQASSAVLNPQSGEQIKWQVIGGGGGGGGSTNYVLTGTVGQTAAGPGSSTNYKINQGFWQNFTTSCCVGKRGNVNCTGTIDLGDLSALVSYLTGGGFILCCYDAANMNGVGAIDLGDLSALVSYLTGGGFVLVNCP